MVLSCQDGVGKIIEAATKIEITLCFYVVRPAGFEPATYGFEVDLTWW